MNVTTRSFPEYPSKSRSYAVVVGSSPTGESELQTIIENLSEAPYIIAVNAMCIQIPCDAVVGCHAELEVIMKRPIPDHVEKHLYPSDQRIVPTEVAGFDYVWQGYPAAAGTSSLAAVLVAKAMGFERVVLAGVPLENVGYANGYPKAAISEFRQFNEGSDLVQQRHTVWGKLFNKGYLRGVTSMSGYTGRLLGQPDFENIKRKVS